MGKFLEFTQVPIEEKYRTAIEILTKDGFEIHIWHKYLKGMPEYNNDEGIIVDLPYFRSIIQEYWEEKEFIKENMELVKKWDEYLLTHLEYALPYFQMGYIILPKNREYFSPPKSHWWWWIDEILEGK